MVLWALLPLVAGGLVAVDVRGAAAAAVNGTAEDRPAPARARRGVRGTVVGDGVQHRGR
jgi:hypothetical protein